MQLSDILEEHSLKNISKKTNISEDMIEYLVERKFEKLERVKAIGFITIIEREYKADLDALRSEAQAYYAEHDNSDRGIIVTGNLLGEKRGKSKWLFFIVLILLAYASWYFVTQYDKSHLNTLQLFKEETEEQTSGMENTSDNDLDIIHTIKQKWNDIVSNAQKEATVTDTEIKIEQQEVSEAAVEVIEPVEVEEAKPEETNVARVAEEEQGLGIETK
ncbi:hypothetical protein PGH07_08755 [Sulfurovum sp. zt1-1]|uniref:Uncharacterized protein n=1 Tax=Sulfurovum zhangzhouensis TaxID=3019067 RepID=A0ABT7QZK4_9BACT|nr:hypothetical protein [Sulfurovum zhangzhouensis]MDM5272269.1 hypothetical protein [Sulfurovum zhangzhouensis]